MNAADPHTPSPGGMLAGKVAIVTGASRGIGSAAAQTFAAAGATVVLAARDEQALDALAQDLTAAGGRALAVPTDVADAASVERLVRRTLDAYGRLDAAFNNAGATHMPAPLADLGVEDFDRVVAVNLRGVFLCMQYEIRAMRESGGGAIVNMSSTAGLQGVRGMAGYAAAKHAIVGLTKAAALDYAAHNVRVNAVAPGPILNERIARLDEAQQAPITRAVPLGRLGRPDEVGALVVWLCSEQAAFITGAVMPIDGGRLSGAG